MRLVLRLVAAGVLSVSSSVFAAGPPVKLDGLAARDFDKLPPDAMLDVAGRVLTKAQLLSEIQSKSRVTAPTAPKVDLGAAQARLEADERAASDAARTSVHAAWESVAPNEKRSALELTPQITSVEHQPILSGGDMTIRGVGFGEEPGEVHLLGPFPGGHLTLPVCAGGGWGIVSCAWRPGVVSTVGTSWGGPKIAGIPDRQLQVVIVTKKGKRSAPFPVAFRAHRVLKRLGPSEVLVVRSNPLAGACAGGGDVTISCSEGQQSLIWSAGSDRIVSAALKNGWTFDSRSKAMGQELYPQFPDTSRGSPFAWGSTVLTYEADRTVAKAVCTYLTFNVVQVCSVDLLAVGPEGVPSR